MDLRIVPSALSGTVRAPSSKSAAHRLLIAAAFASGPSFVGCRCTSEDIDATARCLSALGASIRFEAGSGFTVSPVPDGGRGAARGALLPCGESGSTLRFMLPVAAALGCDAVLTGSERLLERPLGPLCDALRDHGARVCRDGRLLRVEGRIEPGRFVVPGDVSSQYATGLLLAAPLLGAPSEVLVTEPVASRPYLEITVRALASYGVAVARDTAAAGELSASAFLVAPDPYRAPADPAEVEGDWSAATFWLVAGGLGGDVAVEGLDLLSPQGDRAVLGACALLGCRVTRGAGLVRVEPDKPRACALNAEDVPDAVPALSVLCALTPGVSRILGAARLRHKESDRLETTAALLRALGGEVRTLDDGLAFRGVGGFSGGVVDAANDHRIAMAAAVASTRAAGLVTVRGAECVAKSYPGFWDDFKALGGRFEEVRP